MSRGRAHLGAGALTLSAFEAAERMVAMISFNATGFSSTVKAPSFIASTVIDVVRRCPMSTNGSGGVSWLSERASSSPATSGSD